MIGQKSDSLKKQAFLATYAQAKKLYKAAKYKDALQYFILSKKQADTHFGKYSNEHITATNSLANAHFKLQQYTQAETLYLEALELVDASLGRGNKRYRQYLKNLMYLYTVTYDYAKAKKRYQEYFVLNQIGSEPNNPDCVQALNTINRYHRILIKHFEKKPNSLPKAVFKDITLNYLNYLKIKARACAVMGWYEKAELYYSLLVIYVKKYLGDRHINYIDALRGFAQIYQINKKYSLAEIYYLKSKRIITALYGNKSIQYANILGNMGGLYTASREFPKAKALYQESLKVIEDTLGKINPHYADISHNFGYMFHHYEQYEQAKNLYKEVIKIRKKISHDNPMPLVMAMNSLARLYQDQGLYLKAQKLFEEGLQLVKKGRRRERDYAVGLVHLANLYTNMGAYNKAEELYSRSKRIIRADLSEHHLRYVKVLNGQARLYELTGQYTQAEALHQKIRNHPLLQTDPVYLSDLASFYNSQKKYDQAEALYQKTLKLIEKQTGKNSLGYAKVLNRLAKCLIQKNNAYQEAEKLLLEGLQIVQKKLSEKHGDYASYLTDLAMLYQLMRQNTKAEHFLQKSLKIEDKNYPNRPLSLLVLGSLYLEQQKYTQAAPLYMEAIELKMKAFNKNKYVFSEKEQKAYLKVNRHFFQQFEAFFIDYIKSGKASQKEKHKMARKLLDIRLATKAQLLNDKMNLLHFIQQKASTNFALKQDFERYLRLKAKIARFMTMPTDDKDRKRGNISEQIEQVKVLERRLYIAKHYIQPPNKVQYTSQNIRKFIQANEAAVEIIEHKAQGESLEKNQYSYIVLVSTQKHAYPEVILFDSPQMEAHAKTYQKSILAQTEDKTSYHNFWGLIGDYLKKQGIKKVYISPDGVYNQINLNTLRNPTSGKYVEDEIDIQIVTTLRDIVDAPKNKQRNSTNNLVAFFGRPDYHLPIADLQKEEKILKKNQQAHITDFHFPSTPGKLVKQSKQRSGWNDLPGTEAEIKAIAKVLNKKQNLKVSTHLGNEALEMAVKNVKRPKILHIATHGFFVENLKSAIKVKKEEIIFDNFSRGGNARNSFAAKAAKIMREEPMLRSGIVLAGAVSYERATPKPDTEDGILTAYEASQMDLQDTELVVLSACETGLGEVSNGQGVYGLQRAFIAAGAQAVILSLWKVDDEATKMLMSRFYEEWIEKGKTKRAALKAAQLYLRNYKKDGNKIYAAPYYWGAFQMIGE
ncbi:hypothetical protein BKI52_02125 [marine bacterium AO1-C]|nr:hypothetical protein BKI52_02125 [marine bacterium AO1-C]